jgi:plasmid maintenance system antidote protein VapI
VSSDAELIDAVKAGFGLPSDAAVAAFLGISRNSIHAARSGRARLGPIQRLKVLDRIGFLRARSFVEQISPERLAELIRDFSRGQANRIAENRRTYMAPKTIDAELIELTKEVFDFTTDEALAAYLGFPRHRISMIRSGRSTLGPRPRVKLLRLVEDFDLDAVLNALDSSEDLATRVRAYAQTGRDQLT